MATGDGIRPASDKMAFVVRVKYEDGTVNDNLSRPGHPEGCVCVRPLQWIKPAWHSRSRGEL